MEKIPEYNPDYILLQLFDESAETKATYENLLQSGIWKNMTAVKKNQVFMIGDNNGGREWHLFGISPLANRYGVNEIVKVFELFISFQLLLVNLQSTLLRQDGRTFLLNRLSNSHPLSHEPLIQSTTHVAASIHRIAF
jgi:hypothetical protein